METGFERQAIGVFELDSFCACIVAMDAATKAADVKIQGVERNRLKSGACVKFRGTIANVEAAMEAALAAAEPIAKITAHTTIAAPDPSTETAITMTINK